MEPMAITGPGTFIGMAVVSLLQEGCPEGSHGVEPQEVGRNRLHRSQHRQVLGREEVYRIGQPR